MSNQATQKNIPRTMNAWAMYDWANSVYNLVITTAIFPLYFNSATEKAFNGAVVNFFGFSIKNTVLYSYSLSFAYLLIVFLAPVLSGIADYGGKKKRFMQFFTYLGSSACIALFWFDGANVEFGIMASVLACVGFAGGLVFYNSYLPEIVTEDKMDSLSAKGFSLGYIGSVLLLIVNLVMIQMPDVFGFSGAGQASRVSFLLVGFWWMGFAQITFAYLPKGTAKPLADGQKLIKMGILELIKVQKSFQHLPSLTRYLVAFFLYSTGVQTVMLLAPTFAKGEIKVSDAGLIIVVLLIQIVAIFGALLFSSISNKKGNKFAISIMLGIWVVICILAYLVQTEQQFYGLAVLVGLVMGGIQSISRSTYSKLIPENSKDTTSYFSFYDVTEKSSIVLGTFLFGFIEQISGTMRNSTLVLTVFFVLGFIALQRIEKIGKSKEA